MGATGLGTGAGLGVTGDAVAGAGAGAGSTVVVVPGVPEEGSEGTEPSLCAIAKEGRKTDPDTKSDNNNL